MSLNIIPLIFIIHRLTFKYGLGSPDSGTSPLRTDPLRLQKEVLGTWKCGCLQYLWLWRSLTNNRSPLYHIISFFAGFYIFEIPLNCSWHFIRISPCNYEIILTKARLVDFVGLKAIRHHPSRLSNLPRVLWTTCFLFMIRVKSSMNAFIGGMCKPLRMCVSGILDPDAFNRICIPSTNREGENVHFIAIPTSRGTHFVEPACVR